MFDLVVVGAVLAFVGGAARRAVWGRAPAGPVRIPSLIVVTSTIQIGFHAAASAAPSVASVVALVLAGWTTFLLYWYWLSRAPRPRGGDGRDGDGREDPGDDGGGPGRGGPRTPKPGPSGDWEEFEREFWPYVERSRRPVPAADPREPVPSGGRFRAPVP